MRHRVHIRGLVSVSTYQPKHAKHATYAELAEVSSALAGMADQIQIVDSEELGDTNAQAHSRDRAGRQGNPLPACHSGRLRVRPSSVSRVALSRPGHKTSSD